MDSFTNGKHIGNDLVNEGAPPPSPLGPNLVPLMPMESDLPGENKATPQIEHGLGPLPTPTTEDLKIINGQKLEVSKLAGEQHAGPSAPSSKPYASETDPVDINRDMQTNVSGSPDATADASNAVQDLKSSGPDGIVITHTPSPSPSITTTLNTTGGVHSINTSTDGLKEPDTAAQVSAAVSSESKEEFDLISSEAGGSSRAIRDQEEHPHIPNAAASSGNISADNNLDTSRHGVNGATTNGSKVKGSSENNNSLSNDSTMNNVEPKVFGNASLNTQNGSSNLTSMNGSSSNNNKMNNVSVSTAEGGGSLPTQAAGGNGNGAHYLGGMPPREKEKSVFLRLSNQIKELEVNMSIFSRYLDQISTRYVYLYLVCIYYFVMVMSSLFI